MMGIQNNDSGDVVGYVHNYDADATSPVKVGDRLYASARDYSGSVLCGVLNIYPDNRSGFEELRADGGVGVFISGPLPIYPDLFRVLGVSLKPSVEPEDYVPADFYPINPSDGLVAE